VRRTLSAALDEAIEVIGRVDAHAIAGHLLGVDRAYLMTHPLRLLTESEDARLDALVAQRAMGQPVAYLTERREFYGRNFLITPDVLIPRPETETLVEAALERLPKGGTGLDLGTGSGAIAVAIACERRDAAIVATDASQAALAVARANALSHACRIEFVAGSWYEPIGTRTFDLIVANPPYVAAADPHLGSGDLRFEPAAALTDGSADGLASLRKIIAGARAHLNEGGWLLVEHGYDQADAVRLLFEQAGFADPVSIADLAGIPRVACCQNPHPRRPS
jgi:release factor glutamine methyltransferase